MNQDTKQPRTRLDYDRRLPTVPGFVFEKSPFNPGAGLLEFEHGQVHHVPSHEERVAVQVEAEAALIARALRVATDEELAEAGLVRHARLVDEYAKARHRVRVKSNAAALGSSPTLAARWAVLHERVMQAVEMYLVARTEALHWRNKNPGSLNPKMTAADSKGSALMRILEEVAERRAERESGGAS